MNGNGRRPHLVERAALHLNGHAEPLKRAAPPPAAVTDPLRPFEAAAADGGQLRPPFDDTRRIIDRKALEQAGMIDWSQRDSRVTEEFQIALTEILRRSVSTGRLAAPRSRLVMITSALPAEGKSFTAINLAVGIALRGERPVLLVDCDGRQGCLGDRLGVPAGASDAAAIIERQLGLAASTVRTCVENLYFLRLGSGAGNSNEALDVTLATVEALAQHSEGWLVLLDAPACLSSSRPHLLAPLVEQTVLVIAAGSTQESEIEAALGMIRSCLGISLLLNKVGRWHAHSFAPCGAAI